MGTGTCKESIIDVAGVGAWGGSRGEEVEKEEERKRWLLSVSAALDSTLLSLTRRYRADGKKDERDRETTLTPDDSLSPSSDHLPDATSSHPALSIARDSPH